MNSRRVYVLLALCLGLRVPAAQAQDPSRGTFAEADKQIGAGRIVVRVINSGGQPLADAEVELGVLGSDGTRIKQRQRTDKSGFTEFTGLKTGNGQAYRVNLPVDGAVFSSTPFQLPLTEGYRVTIEKTETTHDDQTIVQSLGQFLVEFRDDRLHVSQQSRVVNLGERTVVWKGIHVKLPKGFTALNFEKVMTDQHFEPDEEGFILRGSIGPGEIVLNWAFDLPLAGQEIRFDLPVIWKTFRYRGLIEAPEGLKVSLTGLPQPELYDEDDHKVYASLLQRSPNDAPLETVGVHLRNLPGPGPARWFALLWVCVAIGAAALYGAKAADTQVQNHEAIQKELVARIVELDADPTTDSAKAEYRRHLVEALARLLYQTR